MQCYTILYSKEGYFLIFKKRKLNLIVSSIITPITHDLGLFTFPRGTLSEGEEPFKVCLRAFVKECHNTRFGYWSPNNIETLLYLEHLSFEGSKYHILYHQLHIVEANYNCLYLEFSIDDLREIKNTILLTHSVTLHKTQIWQVIEEINKIMSLKKKKKTSDWDYDMIEYLANQILQFNIKY